MKGEMKDAKLKHQQNRTGYPEWHAQDLQFTQDCFVD